MTTAVAQPQSSDAAAAALPTVSSFSLPSPSELRSESAKSTSSLSSASSSASSSSSPPPLPWSCAACATQPPSSSGGRHAPLPPSLAGSLLVSLFSPAAPLPNPQLAAFTSSHHLDCPSASQLQGALSLLSQDLSPLDLSSGCDSRSLPSSVREWVMTHHVNCQHAKQQLPSSAAADSGLDVPAVRIHEDVAEQADSEQAAAAQQPQSQQPQVVKLLLFHSDSPPLPSLHINSTASVSPSYDWKFIPSRPLPQTPKSTAAAAAASAAAAAAAAAGVAVNSPARSGRSQSFLNPARSAYDAAASAVVPSSAANPLPQLQSPASAPPSLPAQTSPRSAFSSSSSTTTESPAPLSSRSQPAGLAFPSQSRSTSAPAEHHQSRYSIVGLPRPRRLAPVSPTISAAAFHHGGNAASPPSPLPSHLMSQLSPSSVPGAGQSRQAAASVPGAKAASSLAGLHPRKSWDLRDMWVNREQEEIRREEERQAARIRQLARAMNICRLLPHSPSLQLSEQQVASAVRQLKIDLSRLDVGHITTMEREELMLDSAQTLLAVLQLLSSPQLSLQQVKERIAALRLSPDIAEYVIFFFVDAPAHLDHASRAYSRQSSRSRLSLRHPPPPQLSSSSTAACHPASPLHPSPPDLLSELTSYINRRQKEDRINAAQLQRYAQNVGFDLAAVDIKEAEAVLGASKEEEEAGRRGEEEAKEAKPNEEEKEEEKQAAADSADGGSSAQSSPPRAPVELQSARQVVIALQMVYESTVYDDELVLSICRAARMQPETTDYLLQQNRRKRREQQEQDRRERRSIKAQQHIAAAAAAAAASSPSSTTASSSSAPPRPPPPKHWPVTAEDVSALISNHRLCQGWINDADELQELIRVTPLDLSAISPVMIEGLLAADLRFDSPRQVVQALRLLYADLSEEDVKAECRRFSLPSAALPYVLQHRLQHELELEELTVEEVRAEAVRQHRRKKQAAQKAMSVLRFDLLLSEEEEQEVQAVQAREVTLTQLTDSLRQSRLWEGQDVLITEDIVSQLLVEHPFPLSSMDLTQLDSMESESLSFSSPAQLMCALQLLHVDITDDEVRIECRRQGLRPAVAQYIIRHERPIHAQVVISREDSRSRKRGSGGKGSARRSVSLVETLAGGQELVEEWVATTSIADLIGGSTTSEQIVAAVRDARLLQAEDSEQQLDAQQVAAVARELEFDLSVVDLEMIPILASHASHFQSVPQLLTALQLLYTDVNDAEIRSECEEVGMDRKTTRFLVKNSLRRLLLSRPELSQQLDGELVLNSDQRKPGWSDPRYARVVYERGDDDVGVEQLVDASQPADTEHTPLDSRLLMQLLHFFSLLERSSADATAPPSVEEQSLSHALAEVGFDLSLASKEMLLRLYSADCRFSSLLQLVHCLHLLYADWSAEEIAAYCSGLQRPFSRQVTDFIAAHSLRQRRRRAQSRRRSPRDNGDGSGGSSWFTSAAQLGDLVDQFQLLSPSGCTAAALDVALQSVGLELQQVRLADLAKLAEHKMCFSSPAQLVSTLQLLQWDVAGDQVKAEAVRRALPSSVIEYLQEHHAEHLQFIQRGRKREWRRRHVTRYISHDLQREDGDELQGEEVQPARQQLKAKAKAMQAKLSHLQSELLTEGVEVEEQEVEEWVSQFPLSVQDLSVDCVDLIAAQLSAASGRGGDHRRLGSVRDALQCVLELSLEIAERAEEEMVTTAEMVRMMAAGERETPTVVNVSPYSQQSAASASVFRGLAAPTASHSRVSSTPNSARSSSHSHQPLQVQHSAPLLNTAAQGNGSHNSSPSPSPSNASTRPRVSRHHRGAHSVSWNARTREAVLGGSSASDPVKDVEKRSAQILQLKRIIVQNALVMIPAALEPPHSPLPPALLSERKSLPASPVSAPHTAQERASAASASAAGASPPVSGRQLPPPIPSGIHAGYNTKVSPNGSPSLTPSAIGVSATVSPSTPLLSSTSAAAAPQLVAASLSDLDGQYNWDAIVDVVYSIHVICELIKWRAVHSPNLAFPSVAALFDFLHDPECAVFEPEDDLLSLQRTAMELTENDAERDRERDNTLTAYEERSTLNTASRSVKSLASHVQTQLSAHQARPQAVHAASSPQLTSPAPEQRLAASESPHTLPPPLPPTAFPSPPFSPSVVMTINHPFVYPPTMATVAMHRKQPSRGDAVVEEKAGDVAEDGAVAGGADAVEAAGVAGWGRGGYDSMGAGGRREIGVGDRGEAEMAEGGCGCCGRGRNGKGAGCVVQ